VFRKWGRTLEMLNGLEGVAVVSWKMGNFLIEGFLFLFFWRG
jgi:hypothetical protein